MTEARGSLPKSERIQTKKGGEPIDPWKSGLIPESDTLGDQHRDIDAAIATRSKGRQPIRAAGLDRFPILTPEAPRPETAPAPTKTRKAPTIGEYINHRQD